MKNNSLVPTRQHSSLFPVLFMALSLFLSGCAGMSNKTTAVEAVEVAETDPYVGANRKIFKFNTKVDEYVIRPVSDAYLWVTPALVQTGITNFFNNLEDINVALNGMLQGKLRQGTGDAGRFILNTTAGIAGLFDVATLVGLERHEEDFAQTLAVWGVPKGPYLVMPFLGPTTVRGIPGTLFDLATNPATYVGAPIQIVQRLNERAGAKDKLQFIDEAALDPYIFTRESFLQYRQYLINDGNAEMADDVLVTEYELDEEDADAEAVESNKESTYKLMLDAETK